MSVAVDAVGIAAGVVAERGHRLVDITSALCVPGKTTVGSCITTTETPVLYFRNILVGNVHRGGQRRRKRDDLVAVAEPVHQALEVLRGEVVLVVEERVARHLKLLDLKKDG